VGTIGDGGGTLDALATDTVSDAVDLLFLDHDKDDTCRYCLQHRRRGWLRSGPCDGDNRLCRIAKYRRYMRAEEACGGGPPSKDPRRVSTMIPDLSLESSTGRFGA
jgi:hypothetical protein